MKKFEINAYSLDEAKAKAAEMGITVMKNVTPSWKKAGMPVDEEFKTFAAEMMKANRYTEALGVGLIVVTNAGSKDTRKRPYEFVNNVTEGTKKISRVIEVRRVDNGALVGTALKKDDAIKLAKAAMINEKADMVANVVYKVQEGKDLAFELKYTPSADAELGTYVVFGNEKDSF